jgi:tetratricopeptide (TPR) repeat protein
MTASKRYGLVLEWINMCQERPGLATAERLEKIGACDPQDDTAYICRGIALWLRGKYEEALIELEPLSEESYFWVGIVCASLNRDKEAIDALKHSLDLGLLPALLPSLTWIKEVNPNFYETYAEPLLAQ